MTLLSKNEHQSPTPLPIFNAKRFYLPVIWKFWISNGFAFLWLLFSIYLSISWVRDLGHVVTLPVSIVIIAGIAYIPGYLNAFMVASLLLDRQPKLKNKNPIEPVTLLIACWNEEKGIKNTLEKIASQDYQGKMEVIVVDNHSTDRTAEAAMEAGLALGLKIKVLHEEKPGKHHALNHALSYVKTEYVLTVDADTLLHPSAVRFLVARMMTAASDVCAVAGAVLVRNSRENLWTRIQEWDYFLGIASIKRLQGLYQGTLVAQGAYSLYKTNVIRKLGGWPDAIGEDIVLTWRMLEMHQKVYFEPMSIAFTDVPATFKHFARQRSRWARGMIEALKRVKPWKQPMIFTRFLTGSNLVMPFTDVAYTFAWLPGLVLAFCGIFWIVGPLTLLVLPLALLSNFILYHFQKGVFHELGLHVRRNWLGFITFVLCYQMLMSPISVWGYVQETFQLKRVWK